MKILCIITGLSRVAVKPECETEWRQKTTTPCAAWSTTSDPFCLLLPAPWFWLCCSSCALARVCYLSLKSRAPAASNWVWNGLHSPVYFLSLPAPTSHPSTLSWVVAKEGGSWREWEMDSGLRTGQRKTRQDLKKGPCQLLLSVCTFQGQQVLRAVIWQWWPATFPTWLPCLGSVRRCQSESNDPVDFQSKLKALTWTQGAGEAEWMLKPTRKEQSSPDPDRCAFCKKRGPNKLG